jgi:hypothetical protein
MATKKYRTNTPVFRGRFMQNILTAKTVKNDEGVERQEYQCTALFEKGEMLTAIKALCTELMTDKFGTPDKWPKKRSDAHPKGWVAPWIDQAHKDPKNPDNAGEKTYEGYVSGALCLNLKSSYPIEVVLQDPDVHAMPKDIYDGAYYRAHIEAFWYGDKPSSKGNKGISIGILSLQKVREGEPLSAAGVKASSVFEKVSVDTSKGANAIFDEEEDPMV